MTAAETLAREWFSDRRVIDLLVAANEGGSNHWMAMKPCPYTDDRAGDYKLRLPVSLYEHVQDDPPEHTKHELDRAAINKGIELMVTDPQYLRHLRAFAEGNDDAETADVFLQLCVLGEIVYG